VGETPWKFDSSRPHHPKFGKLSAQGFVLNYDGGSGMMGRITFYTLQWTFIALFLGAGLPLLFVSDPTTARVLARLAVLFLGGFGTAMSLDARQKGILQLQHTSIRRSARPYLFDAVTAGIALCGLGLVVTAMVMHLRP
jgi:hypothetical protein